MLAVFIIEYAWLCLSIYNCNFIMHDTNYSVGPKFFGTSTKKSWFDEGDRCSPGPGTHEPQRMDKTVPPNWTVGKDTQRDAFLDKFHRQYPSPDRYKATQIDLTHPEQPHFSVPNYDPQQNPNKIDEGNSLDYRPKYNVPKHKYPDYSFGYTFQRDYSTAVPPPDAYNAKTIDKKSFNRTQRSFSIGERPPPYGEEGRYPYVGKYNVGGDMAGSKFSVGSSLRPEYTVGASPGQFYQIAGDIKLSGKGKTMGLLIEVPKNKDQEDFPSPDKYNPHLPNTARNIINFRGQRSEIRDLAVQHNPSPDKYEKKELAKTQTVSFPKETRESPQPVANPGVGTYNIEKPFEKTLGHMALKLKKLTQFVNPAPSAYNPKEDLTKPTSQRPINLYSDRTDFSKSITGKVGPGVYEVRRKQSLSLGKIGKGLKFDPNRNFNPGPGSYEIPNGIGKLPKYCSGPKKLTTTGFSCIEIERQERMQREKSKIRAKKQQEQQEEEKVLEQMEKVMSDKLRE